MQIYNQDFKEIFTLTIYINSLRMLMAVITVEDIKAEQIDINNIFTESKLYEIIYMKSFLDIKI